MVRLAGLVFLLVACAEPRTGSGLPTAGRLSPAARSVPHASAASAAVAAFPGWATAVRAGDFREAARLLDGLPQEKLLEPEPCYARARVAMALRDFARAKELLAGLENRLPLLAAEIARDRAECALEVGPFDLAARFFGAGSDVPALVKAGLAWERAGDVEKARAALDRAIRRAESRDTDPVDLAGAHAARARVARVRNDRATAASDVRFLLVQATSTEFGRPFESEVTGLSVDDRVLRVQKLAEAGRLDDALREIDELGRSKPGALSPAALAHARGWAYYLSRSDYDQAASLLDEAARLGGKDQAKDTFYAARALSRAQKDEVAILRYEDFARRFAATSFAEEARYQAARLRFLLGKWEVAILSYRAYLGGFGKGKRARFSEAARQELGLALIAANKPAEAVPLFAALAASESDSLTRALFVELEGTALAAAGDTEHAAGRFSSVIRDRPLSFPALAAAARLGRLGRPVPLVVSVGPSVAAPPPLAVELPEKVALLLRLGFVIDAELALRSHEPEIVARYSPRGYEALCDAYGMVGAGAERYRVGRARVKGDALDHAPTDETRWAWNCVYPTPFEDLVRAAEAVRSLPSGLLHAVMRQESAFRSDAVSPANAVGLLQLIPNTAERVAREMGKDHDPGLLRVPANNVELGAFYLKKVLDTFGGNLALAAAAYNAGPRAVSHWLETGEDLPLDVWVARIPYGETRGYVARVVGNLARYTFLRGGAAAVPDLSLELPKGVRAGEGDY